MIRHVSACAMALGLLPLAAAASSDLIERGAYLAKIMDCGGCHIPRGADGAPIFEAGLSGGSIGFEMPGIGIVWPPNLTPDATGLGAWSPGEIAGAITSGLRPDGRMLAPVMPWPGYAGLEPGDLAALVAWLQAQPAVANKVPPPAASPDDAQGAYFAVTLPK